MLRFGLGLDSYLSEHWVEMFRLLDFDKAITSDSLRFAHFVEKAQNVLTREEIEAMVDAQQESIERILGAEPGSLPLLDRAVVDQCVDLVRLD